MKRKELSEAIKNERVLVPLKNCSLTVAEACGDFPAYLWVRIEAGFVVVIVVVCQSLKMVPKERRKRSVRRKRGREEEEGTAKKRRRGERER